ncbi:MAG: type VII secretion target [Conexibacteraceae bacterium]|nr:type VII secretion target [Conexibacteraceae bacterium]
MSSFTVDPASLRAMATVLDGLGQQMSSMQKLPASSASVLGGAAVEQAIEDFCGHWNHGIDLLNQSLKGLTTNLEQAAANYHTSDACIATAAGT